MDIRAALDKLRPGAAWRNGPITGDMAADYAAIIWKDQQQTKPTLAECQQSLDDLAAAKAELEYRQQRAQAYIEKLSPEGSFNTSVGDLLDAVIKALYGDFSELDELSTIIQQIKAQYPKP